MKKGKNLVLETSLVQDNVPVEICPNLYLGSLHAAFHLDQLRSMKIKYILNASGLPSTFPQDFVYLTLEMRDKPYVNILAFLEMSNSFISTGMKSGGVLVHCAGGRSRSPAIIVGHMIKYGEKDFDAAVECIRKVRPVVDINPGFVKQLQAYSRCGGSVLHAHQMVLQNRLGELGQRYDSILDARNKRKKRLNSALNKQLMAEMQHQFLSFKHHEKQSVHLSLPSQENEVESIPFCPVFQQSYGCYNCHTMLFRTSNIIVHRANGKWYQSRNACIVPPALSRTCSSSSAGSQPRYSPNNAEEPNGTLQLHSVLSCPSPATVQLQGKYLPTPVSRGRRLKCPFNAASAYSFPTSPCTKSSPCNASQVLQHRTSPNVFPPLSVDLHPFFKPNTPQDIGNSPNKMQRKNSKPLSTGPIGLHIPTMVEKGNWVQRMELLLPTKSTRQNSKLQLVSFISDNVQYLEQIAECENVFIEPMEWMGTTQHHENGLLYCPNTKCTAKRNTPIGEFSWTGAACQACDDTNVVYPAFIIYANSFQLLS